MSKIVVDIVANTGSFLTDLKRVEKQTKDSFAEIQRAGKVMGAALASSLVAAGAGLLALTKQSISAADTLSKTAQKVGVSTESLSKLSHAAKLADVDMATLQTGLLQLTKRASEAAQGNAQYARTFDTLGVSLKNADGSLRNADELLADVAETIKLIPAGAERSRIALDLFGKSGANLIPMLKDGKQGLSDAAEEAERFGLVVSTQAGQQAEQFNDDLLRLKLASQGLGLQIATELLPVLTALVGGMKDFASESGTARDVAGFVTREINGIARAVRATKQEVEIISSFFDRVKAQYTGDVEGFERAVTRYETALERLRDPAAMAGGLGDWIDPREQLDGERKAREANSAALDEEKRKREELLASLKEYFSDLTKTTGATRENTKATDDNVDAQKDLYSVLQDIVDPTDELNRLLRDQGAELGGPVAQAAARYADELDHIARLHRDLLSLGPPALDQLNQIEQARANAGLKYAEAMKAGTEANDELTRQAEDSARELQGIWLNATDNIADALTTALFDGAESGADAIKNVMENLARDLVQFWLRQNIVVPIQQQLFGGAAGAAGAASGMGGYIGAAGFGLLLGNSQASRAGGALGAAGGYWAGSLGATMATQAVAAGSLGTTLGAALGSAAPIVGTIIGAIIGQALGGLFDGSSDPRFRVADRESDARASSRLDDIIGVARDNMESGSATALANGIRDFDNAIADFLNNDELARVRDALDNWTIDVSGSAATIENVLGQRFTAIMATFPADVQAFVNGATTVEERVQRLAEALSWDDQIDAILGGLRRERDLAGMDEAARQAFLVNEQFDALAAQMTAMHATEAQLAELEEFRAEALANLTVATEAATEAMQFQEAAARDYAATVTDINRQLAEASGASEFQLSLQDIAAGLNENVARLNETARAAGLLSAREEDLGRAHLLAAAQAARAMAQLEEAGRSLAADLYGSEMGDIEAEIARIEAESSGASSAIASFGDAIRETAEAANRATDLLLGDLSPLRDRQKLPLALQAFQRGEIQAEQVLEIGRRLMASGADYNQLFDQVLAIERSRGGAGQSIPTGGGGVQVSGGTDARLLALMERRDELEQAARDAQRFTQASDLAQIVADLAGARGEDFGSVLGNLSGGRATLEQFAADLGLDSVAAVEDYLRALQADSYGIADIAATITAGDRYIVDALRAIFDYQTELEAKPDFGEDLTKPIRVGDATVPEAIVVVPPTEPTPGERVIEERIGDVDERIGQVEGLLERLLGRIADNTERLADGTEKSGAASASWAAGAKPRSTRSDLVKPGY